MANLPTHGCPADAAHDLEIPEIDLLTSLTLRGVELRNRIVMSPMCQYSSTDGFANDWHLVHLGSRAAGGVGLVMVEASAVTPEGRITPRDLGIWKDEHIEQLGRIASFVRSQGAVPGIQLAHAGRKASTEPPWTGGAPIPTDEGGWSVVAPSPIPFSDASCVPTPLEIEGIDRVVDAFEAGARRALSAGFEIIEIHSAHGYLLHEFLSPLSNQRDDAYGGSLENRMRLVLRVAERVRGVMPETLPLFVRISATDWVEGGWDIDESVVLARALRDAGVDLIDVSSGGTAPRARIPIAKGYQVPFARRIRDEANIPTGAVGLITDTQYANELITGGEADLVLLGRELLREPYWAQDAYHDLEEEPHWPLQYGYAVKRRPTSTDDNRPRTPRMR
jgi:2,4-dienoyl-CoA reductase-like NADH-dependent reductase (Old Yellow Enzyme family)